MEVIISHIGADFDSLASMIAAQKLYPRAKLYFTGPPERAVREFMNLYKDFIQVEYARDPKHLNITRLIIVDCRNPFRLGNFKDLVTSPQVEVIIFDHHPPSQECIKGDINEVEIVGATATMLMKKLIEKEIRLSPLEATVMALGIYEETGSLLFSSTTPDDARMVAELLGMGVNLQTVSDFIFQYLNEEQRKLLNDLILSSYVLKIKGFQILIARSKTEKFLEGVALVTHRLMDLERMDAVFIIVEMGDRVHMAARSIRPAIDVNHVMKFFGGGGHATASSAVVKGLSLTDIENKLKKALQRSVIPQTSARDMMSHPVKTIELKEDTSLNNAFEAMQRFGHFSLPVMKDGKLTGIIDRIDVDKARSHGYGNAPLSVYMSKPVVTSQADVSVFQLQSIMMEKGVSCLPILDGENLVGIVTRQDVLEAIHKRDLKAHKIEKPIDRLKKLPEHIRELLITCGKIGDKLKMPVYVVGGFVRDLLLGVENLDIDLVAEGDGILFGEYLAKHLGGRHKFHEKFGTSIVILPDEMHIDVASSRTEYYTRPAALPEVTESSVKQDLYRRDFTINALAIRLNRRYYGEVLDFFGCRKDLANGVVRVLHPMSFLDDPTRILRAVKFEQRYQFRMDPGTENQLRDALSKNIFDHVSAERIRNEFIEILQEARPLPTVKRMDQLKILRLIHKNINLDSRMIEVFEAATGAIVQFSELLKKEGAKSWIIYFNVLVMRLEPNEIKEIGERFHVPGDIISRVSFDKNRIHEIIRVLCSRNLKTSEIYRILDGLSIETMIFIIARTRMRGVGTRILQYLNNIRHIKPLITGETLKKWGITAGPAYKEILRILFDAQLDGQIKTESGAREFYESRLKSLVVADKKKKKNG
ncbi:MAG: CBS domain-containing protein [Firmicutes bacterium]|nr:CBS domain-containing protein [Bacillota bacterium]